MKTVASEANIEKSSISTTLNQDVDGTENV
jgi:hypothetical protein